MKKISIIWGVLLLFAINVKAQLTLEAFVTTGTNMLSTQKDYHPDSEYWSYTPYKELNGINIGANLGVRLFVFDKKWSIGASLGYLFRYHKAKSPFGNLQIKGWEDIDRKHDFLVLPLDFAYHFKFGLGIHLGVEGSWLFNPAKSNSFVDITKTIVVSPLVGVSYSYKRFRFDLFYKHSINTLFVTKYPIRINGVDYIDKMLYRYHDIELRIAFRIFEFKKI
jgi:hypothetical protein